MHVLGVNLFRYFLLIYINKLHKAEVDIFRNVKNHALDFSQVKVSFGGATDDMG